MIYTLTGACPRCGAPIYGVGDNGTPPTAHFTCDCRAALPQPLPDGEVGTLPSVLEADRRWVDRMRSEAQARGVPE